MKLHLPLLLTAFSLSLGACSERPHLEFDALDAGALDAAIDASTHDADTADADKPDATPDMSELSDAAADMATVVDASVDMGPDGSTIDAAINPCRPHPCGDGTCVPSDEAPGYTCRCVTGYEFDGTTCVDINECETGALVCDPLTECENAIGGARCTPCPEGYSGSGASSCRDVNECVRGTDECTTNQHCENEIGGYSCYDAVDVHVYQRTSCVLFEEGFLKCWGWANGYDSSVPASIAPATPAIDLGEGRSAIAVGVGYEHACALLDNGTVKCWGQNGLGQLGYGDNLGRATPPAEAVDLGEGHTAKALAVGHAHTCAILDDDSLKCWGSNWDGNLGLGDTEPRNAPTSAVDFGVGRTVKAIGAGARHTCAILDDDSLRCWGYNGYGQLGYGDYADRVTPVPVAVNVGAGRHAVYVTGHFYNMCAILDDGSAKCWGNNNGELGYGDTIGRPAPDANPINFGGGRSVRTIDVFDQHACALLDDGSVKCWGQNMYGEFGTGDMSSPSAPPATGVDFGPGLTATVMQTANHTCALVSDRSLRCWGDGNNGYVPSMMLDRPRPEGVNLRGH